MALILLFYSYINKLQNRTSGLRAISGRWEYKNLYRLGGKSNERSIYLILLPFYDSRIWTRADAVVTGRIFIIQIPGKYPLSWYIYTSAHLCVCSTIIRALHDHIQTPNGNAPWYWKHFGSGTRTIFFIARTETGESRFLPEQWLRMYVPGHHGKEGSKHRCNIHAFYGSRSTHPKRRCSAASTPLLLSVRIRIEFVRSLQFRVKGSDLIVTDHHGRLKTFALLLIIVLAGLVLYNRESLWHSFEKRPDPTDLAFNRPSVSGSERPIVISRDEKINVDVFRSSRQAVVNIVATTLKMNNLASLSTI